MDIKKMAEEVVEFLRGQPQKEGNVKLLGIKVLLNGADVEDADKVSAYITQNYNMQYKAHLKSDSEAILSIWYEQLVPCNREVCCEELTKDIIELFRNQSKSNNFNLKLLSIKTILSKGINADKISAYIMERYPEYKAIAKQQGIYPIVAISHK